MSSYGVGMFLGGASAGVNAGARTGAMLEEENRRKDRDAIDKKSAELSLEQRQRAADAEKSVQEAVRQAYMGPGQNVTPLDMPAGSGEGAVAPVQDTRPEPQKLVDGFTAGYKKALADGHVDIAQKYFAQGAKVREEWRTQLYNDGLRRYRGSGGKDIAGLVEAYNVGVPDGQKIYDAKVSEDGSWNLTVGPEGGEGTGQVVVPPDKQKDLVLALGDNEMMRKLEAMRWENESRLDYENRSPKVKAQTARDEAATDKDKAIAGYYAGAKTENTEADTRKKDRTPAGGGKGAGGGKSSVFEQKRQAWLALHPDDEQGALDYANNRKGLGNREARLAAERLAAQGKDKLGNPLSGDARRQLADEIEARITGAGAAGGAKPQAGATPPAKDDANLPRVKDKAGFDALKKGDRFYNEKTGKTEVKG